MDIEERLKRAAWAEANFKIRLQGSAWRVIKDSWDYDCARGIGVAKGDGEEMVRRVWTLYATEIIGGVWGEWPIDEDDPEMGVRQGWGPPYKTQEVGLLIGDDWKQNVLDAIESVRKQ